MRSIEEVRLVLWLSSEGLNGCQIARATGIPRGTVRDWRRGKVPRALAGSADRCEQCRHPDHRFKELPLEYAYLLGLYLGDGCISAGRRGVFKLRIVLDRKYQGIVRECAQAMRTVMPGSKVAVHRCRHMNADIVYSYSKAWPCLFPQHGPGRKHHRRIQLTEWQEAIVSVRSRELLRGLIHSDGSHSVNTIRHPKKTYIYPRYLFSNRSDDIRRIFCDACDRMEVEWRRMNRFNISVARRDSVAILDEFIGPKE